MPTWAGKRWGDRLPLKFGNWDVKIDEWVIISNVFQLRRIFNNMKLRASLKKARNLNCILWNLAQMRGLGWGPKSKVAYKAMSSNFARGTPPNSRTRARFRLCVEPKAAYLDRSDGETSLYSAIVTHFQIAATIFSSALIYPSFNFLRGWKTFLIIDLLGSRTGRANTGFAGQIRNFYLCGEEILLVQMAAKTNSMGIRQGQSGHCSNSQFRKCLNSGECVELYDSFTCNCSMTPFGGDKCEQGDL